MRIWKKILVLMLLVMLMPVGRVDAAETKTVTVGEKWYYWTTPGDKYGTYQGSSETAESRLYTRYKYMGEDKGSNPVYCVQSKKRVPDSTESYEEIPTSSSVGTLWTEEQRWVSAIIIENIDDELGKFSKEGYVLTYAVLNSYLSSQLGGEDFRNNNSTLNKYITEAEDFYDKFIVSGNDGLKFNATVVNNGVLTKNDNGEYIGSFKLSGLVSNFGGAHTSGSDAVTYDIILPSGVSLCKDSSCSTIDTQLSKKGLSGEKTFYFKATNVNPGSKLEISIKASNISEYFYGRLWKPMTNSNSQMLLGVYYNKEKPADNQIKRQFTTNVSFSVPEEEVEENSIKISKTDITGAKEISGAKLKICSSKPDAKGNCTVVKNDTVDMEWVSGTTAKVWNGIPAGKYYIVETVAPSGYLPITTAIEFTVDAEGNVVITDKKYYDEKTGKIVVKNETTKFKVIKKDSSTKEVLEGAKLLICTSSKDDKGNYQMKTGEDGFCVPAVLDGNKKLGWTSAKDAYVIEGLAVGTYYLVEDDPPQNYAEAESILFTLKSDGTLVDKDGKAIKDNTLVMFDDPLVDEPKGELPVWKIILIAVSSMAICGGSYYCLIVKDGIGAIKDVFKKKK